MKIEHPKQFKQGVRILMLTLRSKESGKVNMTDRFGKKVVTTGEEEFDKALERLSKARISPERIYSTIEERDINKGIRLFKERQLDADYYDLESRISFYKDIWNRWISCLQSPKSRINTLFLVDIDKEDNEDEIRKEIKDKKLDIVHEYKTKNGRHLILNPFNPNLVSFEVHKNYMMLWEY